MPDVVISFDSTGSMGACISEVRRTVQNFITNLFTSVDNLRVGIINHGSYCDGEKLIDIHDLSADVNSLVKFMQTTRNTNGCDMSHASYEYVFYKAQELNWYGDSRALILIGDCEPHPVGYRTDNRLMRPFNTLDGIKEAKKLVDSGVKIFPIQALNRRNHTHFYQALAGMSNTPKLDLMQFADVREYLTAVIYSQESTEKVQEYATELETSGLFNRNIASMFNSLLNVDTYNSGKLITRNADDTGSLVEVNPARFQVLYVDRKTPIKDFVQSSGARFKIGRGFYQLTKKEEVQERKEVVLVDKTTGDMWSGSAARDMIGLPYGQRDNIYPKHGFNYDVFIQSTSANRVLMGDTKFLYEVDSSSY